MKPSAGRVRFAGHDITRAGRAERRALSSRLQAIFQDPYSSLSPARTVGQILGEPLSVHHNLGRAEIHRRVLAMLERVGLQADMMSRYPRAFSGGQRQRIAIARALMLHPDLVICDEPVSALDLSIQAQILNLLRSLQAELGTSYLFVAHNLAVVRYISADIAVMYRGRIVEVGSAKTVYEQPAHPYSQSLLAAAPVSDPDRQRARRELFQAARRTNAGAEADGCPFARRCPYVIDRCWTDRPPLERAPSGTLVACWRTRDISTRPVVASSAGRGTPLAAGDRFDR